LSRAHTYTAGISRRRKLRNRPDARREKSFPSAGQENLVFLTEPPETETPAQRSLGFADVINILSAKLDRIQSGQLHLCEQVKDLRDSLPVQRRPLGRWAQQIHVEVLNAKRGGLCPACESVRVCDETGRLPGAEFDHWYSRNRNRAEETWLVCQGCNARLSNNTEFKASARSAFESYQLALRRLLQTHQTRQTSLTEPQNAA
jgi:hypothetical protein